MRAVLNRAEFLSAAKRGANIAPHDSALAVLKGLLLEVDPKGVLTMTATNLEVALEQKISCKATDDDTVVLDARLAVAMLDRLSGDTVEVEREPGKPQVHFHSGDAEYLVPIWEGKSYPRMEIPFPEDTVKVSGIPSMAKRTVFAAAEDDSKPLLKCVNLRFTKERLRAAVGNGSCIITAAGDEKSTGDISLLIPALSLEKLSRLCGEKDEFRVGTTGKSIVFLKENFVFSARLLEGDYIDTDKLIGSVRNQFLVLTSVSELRTMAETAGCVAQDGKLCLRFEDERLIFHCSSEQGTVSAPLEVIPLMGMPHGEYWYVSQQLIACLKSLSGTVKLGIAQSGMLTLEADDAYYLQTALRPPAAARKEEKAPAAKAA